MNDSSPSAKRTVVRPVNAALVEDGHRQRVADADEVGEIDKGVETRDLALLRQPAEQRFGRAAVARRLDPERAERAPPGRDARKVRERPVADAFERAQLLVAECALELRQRAIVDDTARVHDSADDGRETLEHLLRVAEHAEV